MAWKWTCDVCRQQFTTSQGLFLHKRLAHQMTVEQARRNPLVQVWCCKICGSKTYYASSYYRHMRMIHGIEPLEEESTSDDQ